MLHRRGTPLPPIIERPAAVIRAVTCPIEE
jgi:hypothetical protein